MSERETVIQKGTQRCTKSGRGTKIKRNRERKERHTERERGTERAVLRRRREGGLEVIYLL